MASVTQLDQGRSVLIMGYDYPVALALHNETDLVRVQAAIAAALAVRKGVNAHGG